LKPCARKEDGRGRYTIRREDGTYRRTYGSILVLESFVGPRPNGHECCHNDGNCLNDSIANLRWGTSAENKADQLRHGTRLRGETSGVSKLTESGVREIRRMIADGKIDREIAELFNVTPTNIYYIRHRKTWKHVDA
jgi:hypothetical protein